MDRTPFGALCLANSDNHQTALLSIIILYCFFIFLFQFQILLILRILLFLFSFLICIIHQKQLSNQCVQLSNQFICNKFHVFCRKFDPSKMVDPIGIEPINSPCKGDVFPLQLRALKRPIMGWCVFRPTPFKCAII